MFGKDVARILDLIKYIYFEIKIWERLGGPAGGQTFEKFDKHIAWSMS
jgi:hypothetical protein